MQQRNHRKRDDRRHFHQLFCQLRSTQNRAHRDVLSEDLGHFDDLHRNMRVQILEEIHQLFHLLRHRIVEQKHQRDCVDNRLPRCAAEPVPAGQPPQAEALAATLRCPRQTTRRTPLPPWSWPSSGSVERRASRTLHLGTKSGAGLRPTPCARSSARVAATSGAAAPSSAARTRHHVQP